MKYKILSVLNVRPQEPRHSGFRLTEIYHQINAFLNILWPSYKHIMQKQQNSLQKKRLT